MDIKDAYTTQELTEPLGYKTKQAVLDRASREGWQSRPRTGRGGGKEWLLSSMPEKTRLLIASRVCSVTPASLPPERQSVLAEMVKLKGKVKIRAEARTAVLLCARVFTVNSGLSFTVAMTAFAARWNAGEINAEQWVREALPTVCRNSLINWEKAVQSEGVARLGGKYGLHRKGTGRIDSQQEVQEVILGMLFAYPSVQARNVLEKLKADFHDQQTVELPSLRRLQRWIKTWKEDHADAFQFIEAPDKWKGARRTSCGDAYELLTYPNERWEYDGTPADLMLNDGKRYTIVGIIDVYTRRLKLEVTPTSTSRTVARLTHRCLLDWGIPQEAVTDNGKEFTSRHMEQVFVDLEIIPTVLPPFKPELKSAIERVFRTFSHDLLPVYPCYLGHDVANRQKIRERETFAKRLMNKKTPSQLSIGVSPEDLQVFCDNWTDRVYAHRPHSGFKGELKGKTPFEVSMEWDGNIERVSEQGERALAILLLPRKRSQGKVPEIIESNEVAGMRTIVSAHRVKCLKSLKIMKSQG